MKPPAIRRSFTSGSTLERPLTRQSSGRATRLLVACIIAVVSLMPTNTAHADNFFGGRIVDGKTLYLGVGFPQLEIATKFQILVPELDIGARFTMEFARETTIACCHLQFAADVRYRVIDDGPLQGSLLFSLPMGVTTKGGNFSLGLVWPGFAVSYGLADDLDLDFGLQVQLTLLFEENTITQAWIDAFVGLTYYATDAISVGFRFDVGPDIYGAPLIARSNRLYEDIYVGLHFRGMIAAGFDL